MERFNENKWANDFKELGQNLLQSRSRISSAELDKVLNWYSEALLDETKTKGFLPLCSSPCSFHCFFFSIYELYKISIDMTTN